MQALSAGTAVFEAIKKANSMDKEAITNAMSGLTYTVAGNQITMGADYDQAHLTMWVATSGY